ncbi:MAG TPA: Flp family type IVb pilin [Desulfitobacterium sp.]|nr:Flp family type IVb pilin [Desulfitobacterium sp.]
MKNKLMGLLKDDAGQAMTEYGLIIALVAVVVIAAVALIGTNLNGIFGKVSEKLQ